MPETSRAALVVVDADGQAEVGDLRAAAAVDHDVAGLQVPVQHALVVRRAEARAHLARDLDRLVGRKPPDAPQQRGQVLAVDVLHREEVPSLDLADVVDAADVGVRDAAGVADLGVEAVDPGRLRGELRRQELQRDRLPELQVVGAVDLAHAAAADEADDAVALAEDRAGREAAAVERRRGRDAADRAIRRAPPLRRLRHRRRRQTRRQLRGGPDRLRAGRAVTRARGDLGRAGGTSHRVSHRGPRRRTSAGRRARCGSRRSRARRETSRTKSDVPAYQAEESVVSGNCRQWPK